MSFKRDVEYRYPHLAEERVNPKYSALVENTFPECLSGTIEINETDKVLSHKQVMALSDTYFAEYLDIKQRYTLEQSGYMHTFRDGKGAKNSRKILRLLAELNPELTPNSKIVQQFIATWTRMFSTAKIEYKIGYNVKDFRLLGHTQCDNVSCFRADGINSHHAILLYYYLPSFIIWLNHGEARCWGFIHPDNPDYIYLSNFYYDGIDNNKSYFVRILEKVINKGILTYSDVYIRLGVYTNGDSICVRPFGKPPQEYRDIASCIECDNGDYWLCEDCATGYTTYCDRCESRLLEDETYSDNSGHYYCEYCYTELYTRCNKCNQEIERADCFHTDYTYYCEQCFYDLYGYCEDCNEARPHCDLKYIEKLDSSVCEYCLEQNYTDCNECGRLIPNTDLREITELTETKQLCRECFEHTYNNPNQLDLPLIAPEQEITHE